MSKLDKTKEQLNYLKLWLGFFVVSAVALVGWLAQNLTYDIKTYLAMIGVVSLTIAIYFLHKTIMRKIDETEDV